MEEIIYLFSNIIIKICCVNNCIPEQKSDNNNKHTTNRKIEIVSPNSIRHSDRLIEIERDYDIQGGKTVCNK